MATYHHCELALEQHEQSLSRRMNVVGLGISEEAGDSPLRYRLTVYVSKMQNREDLTEADQIPATLPVLLDGGQVRVETSVVELGEVGLE